MKKHFGKKAAALALVLSLFVSLLSVAAAAAEPETDEEGPALPPIVETTEGTGTEEQENTIPDISLLSDDAAAEEPVDESPVMNDESAENLSEEEAPAADLSETEDEAPAEEQSAASSVCTNGGEHTFGTKQAANYAPCSGGIKTEFYVCTVCRRPFNTDGSEAEWVDGTNEHTLGEKHEPNYTPSGGGYQTEFYYCTVCGRAFNSDGSYATYVYPVCSTHTLGEKREPNYTPCYGGYQTDYYECTTCRRSFNADGSEATYVQGTGEHTLGEKNEPFYAPCGGGYQTEWYDCTVCGADLNADGSRAEWIWGNGEHQFISYPAKAPTYEENGWLAHWICSVCRLHLADSEGKDHNVSSFWLPPLTRDTEVTTENLNAVPETVAGQYATVEAIKTALLDIARAAGFDAGRTNAGSVLFDAALQIKNADGTLTPVSPENFPAEGVSVVLPFPAGTDKNYTFIITHMITHGDRAGEIEVLPSVNSEDGICVHFTSMSPVCISYMLQSSTPAPETSAPAAAAPVSTVPRTSDPAHGAPWGMLALLSTGGLAALFAAGKKLRSF